MLGRLRWLGRTEFLTLIESEPRLEAQTNHESEMALFCDCIQKFVQKRA